MAEEEKREIDVDGPEDEEGTDEEFDLFTAQVGQGQEEGQQEEQAEEEQPEEEQEEEEPRPSAQSTSWETPPLLTEQEYEELKLVFDEDQLRAITSLVTTIADRRLRTERQAQRAIAAAGLSDRFTAEYGEELEQALSALPPEMRANPEGVRLAAVGAIHARTLRTGSNLADELIRAAELLGQQTPQRKTQRAPQRRPDAVPAARTPAQTARSTTTRASTKRGSYFASEWGVPETVLKNLMEETNA